MKRVMFNLKNLKYLALVGHVGIVMITPILGGMLIGRYLVMRFDLWTYLPIFLTLLGIVVGFYNAFRLLMKS